MPLLCVVHQFYMFFPPIRPPAKCFCPCSPSVQEVIGPWRFSCELFSQRSVFDLQPLGPERRSVGCLMFVARLRWKSESAVPVEFQVLSGSVTLISLHIRYLCCFIYYFSFSGLKCLQTRSLFQMEVDLLYNVVDSSASFLILRRAKNRVWFPDWTVFCAIELFFV